MGPPGILSINKERPATPLDGRGRASPLLLLHRNLGVKFCALVRVAARHRAADFANACRGFIHGGLFKKDRVGLKSPACFGWQCLSLDDFQRPAHSREHSREWYGKRLTCIFLLFKKSLGLPVDRSGRVSAADGNLGFSMVLADYRPTARAGLNCASWLRNAVAIHGPCVGS